jgi:hypothetical protein
VDGKSVGSVKAGLPNVGDHHSIPAEGGIQGTIRVIAR